MLPFLLLMFYSPTSFQNDNYVQEHVENQEDDKPHVIEISADPVPFKRYES